jgi:hypothetical protein
LIFLRLTPRAKRFHEKTLLIGHDDMVLDALSIFEGVEPGGSSGHTISFVGIAKNVWNPLEAQGF